MYQIAICDDEKIFTDKLAHIYATDLNVCTKMKTAPRGLPLTPV